ncbi:2OG-Fe(II) oxygenase [Niveispirillum fermenti]|uniref:2OG-Fe(II) oxygenase n=1 Tax=Niveispirillum fermenti TaxID=1233113 RepID=UPI003A87A03D
MNSQKHPAIHLNPSLDRPAIGRALQAGRRAQVKNIFPKPVADALYECLSKQVPWNTIFSEGDQKVHALHPTQVAAMTPAHHQWLTQFVIDRARDGYQSLYENYPIWDLLDKKIAPDLYVFRFVEFFNSPEFLDFIREISGVDSIAMTDAQATLFRNGHFLARHTDGDYRTKGRRMAYVLNMTPVWRTEWGGILEFTDDDGNVIDGFMPAYNTLNLFYVPSWHHVSYVTPFAAAGRYGITGWLRDAT